MDEELATVLTPRSYSAGGLVGSFAAGLAVGGLAVWGYYQYKKKDEFVGETIVIHTPDPTPVEDEEDEYDPTVPDVTVLNERREPPQAYHVIEAPEPLERDEADVDLWPTPLEEKFADVDAELMLAEDEEEEALSEPYSSQVQADPDDRPINNLFKRERRKTWNHAAELAKRTPTRPYIIHHDEYVADDEGFDQVTWTWYEGDAMMANSREEPVYDWFDWVGNLDFGYGSEDPSIVYVRNEDRGMDFEVLLHTGRYDIEVLGTDPEDVGEE